MAGEDIKVGSVVQLPAGGPLMTVITIEGDSATCTWHDDKQNAKYGAYPVGSLQISKPGQGVYLA